MGRRGVEIALLVPDLGPTCFDRLGVVGFVELGRAHLVDLVYLVDVVCFFYLIHLVSVFQPKKPNKPDKPNKQNMQDMLAGFLCESRAS